MKTTEKLAKSGNVDAQLKLAAEFGLGDEIHQHLVTSFFWYVQAAKQGSVEALWNIGVVLLDGLDGFERRPEAGSKYIALAAESFHPSAMYYVLQNYESNADIRKILGTRTMQEIENVLGSNDPGSFYQFFIEPVDVAKDTGIAFDASIPTAPRRK